MDTEHGTPYQLTAAEVEQVIQVFDTVRARLHARGCDPRRHPGQFARAFVQAVAAAVHAGTLSAQVCAALSPGKPWTANGGVGCQPHVSQHQ
jgi:hypothetical protein